MMDINKFWNEVITQNEDELRNYFHEDAIIKWPNTHEQFSAEEYIRVNCDYPGKWKGEIERIEEKDDLLIVVGHVLAEDESESHHVVSFIRVKDDKITEMVEYWGQDSDAPDWRRDDKDKQ